MEHRNTDTSFFKKSLSAILLFAISFSLLYISNRSLAFSDWYSAYIYNALVNTIGRISGIVPFSLSEVLLYLLIFIIIFTVIRLIILTVKKTDNKKDWTRFLSNLISLASILFFIYTIACGINYNRSSFSATANMETESYSAPELASVCQYLAKQVNSLSSQIDTDSDECSVFTVSVPDEARKSMRHLGEIYPALSGYYPSPKGLLVSSILSVQNLTGVYSPFTIEANYNDDILDYNIPFTACHELSHLRGFMQEEEANFIGFLACINSENTEFQYSGYLMGWIYASNQLYRTDPEAYTLLYESLCDTAKNDLSANTVFWNQYEGTVAEVSNQINDSYLKANGQSDGVQSYDRMVDLMMVYYKEEVRLLSK